MWPRPLVHRPSADTDGRGQGRGNGSGDILGGYRVRLEWACSNQTTLCFTRGERLKSAVLSVRFPALLYLLGRGGRGLVPCQPIKAEDNRTVVCCLGQRPRTSLAGALQWG